MKREFLIDEIIFGGVSGEVGGTVEIDAQSGSIDQIDCRSFQFWRDDTDFPTILDDSQREAARQVVEQLLEADSDIGELTSPWHASADSVSRLIPLSPAKQSLAEYLQTPARAEPAAVPRRRAQ